MLIHTEATAITQEANAITKIMATMDTEDVMEAMVMATITMEVEATEVAAMEVEAVVEVAATEVEAT